MFSLLLVISVIFTHQTIPTFASNYIFVNTPLSWSAADTYCQQQYGTNLASIHSDADGQQLWAAIDPYVPPLNGTKIWLGLTDKLFEGIYAWSDGSLFDYGTDISGSATPPWYYNQPDNYNNNEDCINIYPDSQVFWDDDDCSSTQPFVCNVIPTPSTAPSKAPTKNPTNNPTSSLTKNPSSAPTQKTTPSKHPTETPTVAPQKPTTRSPTYEKRFCSSKYYYTYCYDVDVYPSNKITATRVNMTDGANAAITYFNITFIPRNADCIDPKITFEYEQIDVDSVGEYIDVINDDGSLIKRCNGNGGVEGQCDIFWVCLNDTSLGIDKIKVDTAYQIKLFSNHENGAMCSTHYLAINAQLTLNCNATEVMTTTSYPKTTGSITTTTSVDNGNLTTTSSASITTTSSESATTTSSGTTTTIATTTSSDATTTIIFVADGNLTTMISTKLIIVYLCLSLLFTY